VESTWQIQIYTFIEKTRERVELKGTSDTFNHENSFIFFIDLDEEGEKDAD